MSIRNPIMNPSLIGYLNTGCKPDNALVSRFRENGIDVKIQDDLVLFKYKSAGPPPVGKFHQINIESRGCILRFDQNTAKWHYVCRPFDRFFNYGAIDAHDLSKYDLQDLIFEEKLDGSIVKLWFDKLRNSWIWSTNTLIEIPKNSKYDKMLNDAGADKLTMDNLPTDMTHIFELVHPDNKIVIQYNTGKLIYLTSKLNNRHNIELDLFHLIDNFVDKPKQYVFKSLDDAVTQINQFDQEAGEGCVVKFAIVSYNDKKIYGRVKLKSKNYLNVLNLASTNILDAYFSDSFDDISAIYPNYFENIKQTLKNNMYEPIIQLVNELNTSSEKLTLNQLSKKLHMEYKYMGKLKPIIYELHLGNFDNLTVNYLDEFLRNSYVKHRNILKTYLRQ